MIGYIFRLQAAAHAIGATMRKRHDRKQQPRFPAMPGIGYRLYCFESMEAGTVYGTQVPESVGGVLARLRKQIAKPEVPTGE